MNTQHFDPLYVQITRQDAATILGVSPTELNRLRRTDPRCPLGFKKSDAQTAQVKFRLSDIYKYSADLMEDAVPAGTTSPAVAGR